MTEGTECPTGHYCETGSTLKKACAAGTYNDETKGLERKDKTVNLRCYEDRTKKNAL